MQKTIIWLNNQIWLPSYNFHNAVNAETEASNWGMEAACDYVP